MESENSKDSNKYEIREDIRISLAAISLGLFLIWIPILRYAGLLALTLGIISIYKLRKQWSDLKSRTTSIGIVLFLTGLIAWTASYFIFQWAMNTIVGNTTYIPTLEVIFHDAFAIYLISHLAAWSLMILGTLLSAFELMSPRQSVIGVIGWISWVAVLMYSFLLYPEKGWITINNLVSGEEFHAATNFITSYYANAILLTAIPSIILMIATLWTSNSYNDGTVVSWLAN